MTEEPAVAEEPAQPELDADAWTGQWRRLALPDPRYSEGAIVSTPSGWLMVSSAGPFDSYAYRSSDGVCWTRLHFPEMRGRLTGVAYGRGRYVIVGYHQGAGHLVLLSTDGETWRAPPAVPDGYGLDGVQFAGGRFFGRELDVWTSEDAESWTHSRRDGFFAPAAVAYGAERYVLVGIGAPQLSSDGIRWRSAPIDCALFSACFTDYVEGTPTNQYRAVFFGAGHFYLAQLRSRDGESWERLAGPTPTGYLSGRLVRRDFAGTQSGGTLLAWTEGGTPQAIDVLPAPQVELPSEGNIPESLDYSFSDGLDCTVARCVLVGRELYLVP